MPKENSEPHLRIAVKLALVDLADACQLAPEPQVVSSICTAVANLIAGAGPWGGTDQSNLMNAAERLGFRPGFYGSTIRVSWGGKA